MATLYPTLEDVSDDQVLKAQANVSPWGAASAPVPAPVFASAPPPYPYAAPPVAYASVPAVKADDPPVLYHNLPKPHKYMGLDLSSKKVQKKLALVLTGSNAVVPAVPVHGGMAVPATGNNLGMHPAEIKPRLREIHLWKDERGKTGLTMKSIGKGVFVLLVKDNSPAALVGLRIGEQILQIDGRDCAKWSAYKAKKALKKAPSEKIIVVVRERPFQRTVTLHRDGTGHLGFVVKKGKVASIAEGSPAASNGLLTGHYICEVNGQNVMGLKDKKIINILTDAVDAVTLTIIPVVIYEHMVRMLRDDSSDESTSFAYESSPFMDSSSAGFDSHCVHSGGFSDCSHDF